MEQTLATAAANFARHNNNDLKDVSKSSVEHQQAFMSQLLKFQALNMSMQNHHSHQNINNKVDSSDNEPPTSPDEAIEKDDLGMISHKKSLITTIFGHMHKIQNFIKKIPPSK